MGKLHLSNRRTGAFLIFLLLIFLWPLISAASSEPISDSDLDDADLVEFSSHIMSIDYGKGVLVVAENVVMIVDLLIGGEQFTTQITNPDDEAISMDSLYQGQKVLVQGFKLKDGRVVAARVQQR
jgi:hypothetical protein